MLEEARTTNGAPWLGILIGFLGGAVIGAGAALLLAPVSGAESRKKLAEAGRRTRAALERRRAHATLVEPPLPLTGVAH